MLCNLCPIFREELKTLRPEKYVKERFSSKNLALNQLN
jgi:hypothetical protein